MGNDITLLGQKKHKTAWSQDHSWARRIWRVEKSNRGRMAIEFILSITHGIWLSL